jgi:hypothetical protein
MVSKIVSPNQFEPSDDIYRLQLVIANQHTNSVDMLKLTHRTMHVILLSATRLIINTVKNVGS